MLRMDAWKVSHPVHNHNEVFSHLLSPAPYQDQVSEQSFLSLRLQKHYYVKQLKRIFLV